jgi:segregation and condensation protein A
LSYLVHLQQFEGPLGLLLYLIRKEEMDIFDINVNEITRQYLEYIRMMKELDLEVAGEFVAMAATLIHIKSRMLLPQYNETGEQVEQVEDPRKELVQKLLEYQKYQEAAKRLYERPLLGRDVFTRGVREDLRSDETGEIIVEDDGLFSLIAAYRRCVRKAQKAVHKVRPKVQSIASRVLELKDKLVVGTRVVMKDLLGVGGPATRVQLLVTFLSLLELGRMGFVSIFQNDVYGDIYIDLKKPIERNVLERVQEFDAGDAEAVAANIINTAVEEKIDMAEAMAGAGDESGQLAFGESPEFAAAGPEQILGEETGLEALIGDIASDDEILAAELEIEKSEAEQIAAAASEPTHPDEEFERQLMRDLGEGADGDAGSEPEANV